MGKDGLNHIPAIWVNIESSYEKLHWLQLNSVGTRQYNWMRERKRYIVN